MTISRSSLVLAVLLLAAEAGCAQEPKAEVDVGCSNISPSVERACIGKRIAATEAEMAGLLKQARKAVERSHAAYGAWDNRTDPKILDRSQSAWSAFVEANCNVMAAYGGGSNSAISDRVADCYEEELGRRIAFLRDLAGGTGRFGL